MRAIAKSASGESENLFCDFAREPTRELTDGDWPSGKAMGSGPMIGVKIASGNLQGNLSDSKLV
jgi:hypothetical protein